MSPAAAQETDAEPAPDERVVPDAISEEAEAACQSYAREELREMLERHPELPERETRRYVEAELHECRVKAHIASSYESVVVGDSPAEAGTAGRATSEITRRDLQERLPRSAPDALRYEPGVYVQQTAHSQGSAYIRGVTGQQTVLAFDGIRLNNSTYRQGPNQYFFTVDSRSVSSIEVVRGSASVLYGSDAIGGAILAHPAEPSLREGVTGLRASPRTHFRGATADDELGGRFELDAQYGDRLGFVGGVGYREVGLLEAGGQIHDTKRMTFSGGERLLVPSFAEDGRTQLGTGFDEATMDGRLVYRLGEHGRAVLGVYRYMQFDAPRTDQCPPPFASPADCLTYEEQFRTLAYLALEGSAGPAAAAVRLTLSYQQQHERRRLDRPASILPEQFGRDDVDTFGVTLAATTERWRLGRRANAVLAWGVDGYEDRVDSVAWYIIDTTRRRTLRYSSRGQYLDHSGYRWFGVYGQPEVTLFDRLTLRAGARFSAIEARAPEDPASGSLPVDQSWSAVIGRAGAAYKVLPPLTVLANVDQGFRAPNLDDMTSRQLTGPGFQFENAALEPERSLTLELGSVVETKYVDFGLWGYRTTIRGAMARRPANTADCPPNTPACNGAWFAFQLVNVDGTSEILGFESTALVRLPYGFRVRTTLAYARGDGPNPATDAPPGDRVPLSRVPPLNGTIEAMWRGEMGVYGGAALRWAAWQKRLAPQDLGDARIPLGGTPEFAVLDLRAGYRLGRQLVVGVVLENVTDAAYRYHGSSVNGAGRGLIFDAELGI